MDGATSMRVHASVVLPAIRPALMLFIGGRQIVRGIMEGAVKS